MSSGFDSDFAAISAALGGLSTTSSNGVGGASTSRAGGASGTSSGGVLMSDGDQGLGSNTDPSFVASVSGGNSEGPFDVTTRNDGSTLGNTSRLGSNMVDSSIRATSDGSGGVKQPSGTSLFGTLSTGFGGNLGILGNLTRKKSTQNLKTTVTSSDQIDFPPERIGNVRFHLDMDGGRGRDDVVNLDGTSRVLSAGSNVGLDALGRDNLIFNATGSSAASTHFSQRGYDIGSSWDDKHKFPMEGVGMKNEMERDLNSGMSSTDGSFFVVTGQQPFSGELPSRFVTSPTAKYKITKITVGSNENSNFCYGLINQGPTFCLEQNCRINHKGGRVLVDKGNLYVVKPSGKAAFLEPTVSSTHVDPDLLKSWLDEKLVLDEWNERFMVVKSSGNTVNEAVFKLGSVFAREAKMFKSPLKSESFGTNEDDTDTDNSPMLDAIDPYTPRIKNVEKFIENKGSAANLSRVVSDTEQTLAVLTDAFRSMQVTTGEMYKRINVELPVLFSRQENLESIIGKRGVGMDPAFEAPTVWSSFSLLAGYVGELTAGIKQVTLQCAAQKKDFDSNQVLLQGAIRDQLNAVNAQMHKTMSEESQVWDSRIISLRTNLVQSLHDIATRINQDKAVLDDTVIRLNSVVESLSNGSLGKLDYVGPMEGVSETHELRQALVLLNAKVDDFLAENDREAVKFGNLGLKRFPDACAFLDTAFNQHADYNFALIVDAHIVFEHIHVVTNDTNSLSRLQLANKVKLDSLSQGIAFTSFDKRIPRIFAADENIRSRGDESFFDKKITSYRDWNAPQSGTRDYMKRLLNKFVVAHKRLIREHPACGPRNRSICSCIRSFTYIYSVDTTLLHLHR